MPLLPPVVAVLAADTKEFTGKMDEAQAKMEAFGATSDTAGAKFKRFGNVAANAVLGLGAAVVGFSVDQGFKFQESMDRLQNATGLTNNQIKALEGTIFKISDTTGAATADLATAMANIEQAGIRGAKATTLLDDAAKAALATNTNVVDVTNALVAAQSLQIAKGMDVTKLTGILVAGSHDFVGGLSAEVAMLQGKVGTALANYGVNLKTSIELGAIFARVGLPTRSIASFVNGLGKLEAPLMSIHTSSKGSYTTLSTYAVALQQVGLSQQKLASDLRVGNIAGLLDQIKMAAQESHQPLSELMNIVFGTTGGAAASLVAKSPGVLRQIQEAVRGAGGGTLNKAFNTAADQFGNKLHIIENELKNSAAQFGLVLLPFLERAATFVENALTSLATHPGERRALEIDFGVTVGAAIALKIAQALQATTQTTLLGEIAANTAATATATETTAAEGGGGSVAAGAGAGAAVRGGGGLLAGLGSDFAGYAGIIASSAYSLQKAATDFAGTFSHDPFQRLWNALTSSGAGKGRPYNSQSGPRSDYLGPHKTVTVIHRTKYGR